MDEEIIYGPEIIISPYTNRPVTTPATAPIFWCEVCCLKLITPRTIIQHMNRRNHKHKIREKNDPTNQDVPETKNEKRKRRLDESNAKPADPVGQQPATKKSKEKPTKEVGSDPNLKCEDCNLVFLSPVIALQHFKGKKHASAVAAKVVAKRGGQRGGRGRGGRGRGRGNGFGRGRGFMPGGYNSGFGRGAAAGQLIRALKFFYGEQNLNDPSINDNFSGSSGNYYSNDYGTNNYSASNVGYW